MLHDAERATQDLQDSCFYSEHGERHKRLRSRKAEQPDELIDITCDMWVKPLSAQDFQEEKFNSLNSHHATLWFQRISSRSYNFTEAACQCWGSGVWPWKTSRFEKWGKVMETKINTFGSKFKITNIFLYIYSKEKSLLLIYFFSLFLKKKMNLTWKQNVACAPFIKCTMTTERN